MIIMSKKQGRNKKIAFNSKSINKDFSDFSNDKQLTNKFKINDKYFKWSLVYCHWEHGNWKNPQIDIPFFVEHIVSKLQNYETQTWQEVLNASGGKSEGNGNNNHFILATKLPKKEQTYYMEKKYMRKFDKVFSLRLSGKERLIGFIDGVIFRVLWYDNSHTFFPCN